MSYGRAPLPSSSQMGARLHIAGLPGDIREREIEKKFDRYGKVVEVTLKGNYCFLQYRSSDSARDAVREMNDAKAFGERISVQYAKNPKQFGGPGGGRGRDYDRRDYDRRDRRSPPRSRGSNSSNRRGSPPRRSDFRLAVTNLSTRCSWQDLKSVMSKAGDVVFADAHKRTVGEGVVEFDSKRDMEKALTKLDGLEINGKPIKLEVEESRIKGGSRSSSRSSSGSGSSRSRSRSGSPKRKRSRKHSDRSRGSRSRSSEKKSSEDEKEASDAENGDDGVEKNEEEEENENEQPDQKVSLGHLDGGEDGADAEFEEAEHAVESRREGGSGSDDEAVGQQEINGDEEENNSEEEAQEEEEEEEESRDGAEEEPFKEEQTEEGEKEEEEPEKPTRATRKRKSLRGQQS